MHAWKDIFTRYLLHVISLFVRERVVVLEFNKRSLNTRRRFCLLRSRIARLHNSDSTRPASSRLASSRAAPGVNAAMIRVRRGSLLSASGVYAIRFRPIPDWNDGVPTARKLRPSLLFGSLSFFERANARRIRTEFESDRDGVAPRRRGDTTTIERQCRAITIVFVASSWVSTELLAVCRSRYDNQVDAVASA